MAADLYVGPLSSCYAGERAAGMPEDVPRAVRIWRQALARQIGEPAMDWDESAEAPWFREPLSHLRYGQVVLLAVYADRPTLPRPTEVVAEWAEDRALGEAERVGYSESSYRQVIAPRMWLPFEADAVYPGPAPDGAETAFGSSPRLLDHVRRLNEATFRLDLLAADDAGGADLAGFEAEARAGLIALARMAAKAVEHGLPLVLGG